MKPQVFILLMLSIQFLASCDTKTSGGTVDIPNGYAGVLEDEDGKTLPNHTITLIPENAQFNESQYYTTTSDKNGVFKFDSIPSGSYTTVIRNHDQDQGVLVEEPEIASDSAMTWNNIRTQELQTIQLRFARTMPRKGWVGIQKLDRWHYIKDPTDSLPFTNIPQGNYQMVFMDDKIGKRIIDPDLVVENVNKTIVDSPLIIAKISPNDNMYLFEESFRKWTEEIGFSTHFTTEDLAKDTANADLIVILPHGSLSEADSVLLAQTEIPLLSMEPSAYYSCGMAFMPSNVGIEKGSYWQVVADVHFLPNVEDSEALEIFSQASNERDSVAWTYIGSPGITLIRSLLNPDHSLVFWFEKGKNSQPHDYTYSSSRAGFGIRSFNISAKSKEILHFLIYRLLNDEGPGK